MEIEQAPIQEIIIEEANAINITVKVLRLDLIHTEIGGNKWYKLKYNITYALQNSLPIVTFGGAYSNHIAATAATGKLFNIKTIGIIRGDKVDNPTLSKARDNGMTLYFIGRDEYKRKATIEFKQDLERLTGIKEFHLVPEGGNNDLGFKGACEILQNTLLFTHVCVACGTGTTLAGIVSSLNNDQLAVGFTVLKNKAEIFENVNAYLKGKPNEQFLVDDTFHFGGYAKYNSLLLDFMREFEEKHNIPLDHVYTGKLFYGVVQKIKQNYFKASSRILIIHTGGLQGKLS